jgi:hypothetical protein
MKNRPQKCPFTKLIFKILMWWGYMMKLDFKNLKNDFRYPQQGTKISKNIAQGYFA